MTDRHYLLKVLGLSGAPKLITFVLTWVSFPLMIRSLGADQYGIMVYLASVTTILELFVSFGINLAAGRAISSWRAAKLPRLDRELYRWIRLQLTVALSTFWPVFGMGYLFIARSGTKKIETILYVIVAITVLIAVFVTFMRTVLQSMLAFKMAAVLDTVESAVRSAGWLMVGLIFKTVISLALTGLITSLAACLLGVFLITRIRWKADEKAARYEEFQTGHVKELTMKQMFRESCTFLGLVMGTRAFQALPIVFIGRLLGLEIVGVIGAFGKIVEMIALPFTIIGNALMVRAQEIKERGIEIVNRYWNLLFRLSVMAIIVTGGVSLIVAFLAGFMLPNTPSALQALSIMIGLILFRAVSDLFAPASDYVGGLRSRLAFLLFCAAMQLPVIWGGIVLFGGVGALATMVGCYGFMVFGYVYIAKRVFFGMAVYRPAKDVFIAVAVVLVSIFLAAFTMSSAQGRIILYLLILTIGYLGIPLLRKQYVSLRFLRFDLV